MAVRFEERLVLAQCSQCHDLFTVSLVDRRGELRVEPSQAAVPDESGRLCHRPGHCGGQVTILWSDLGPPLVKPWPSYDPLAERPWAPEVAREVPR